MTAPLDENAQTAPSAPLFEIATAPGDLPIAEIQARAALQEQQFRHDNTITPPAPAPDTPVEVLATSGTHVPLARAVLCYTTDGTRPDLTSSSIPMAATRVDWELRAGYLTRWHATIPPQPIGTVVRYRIAGWHGGTAQPAERPPDRWAQDGQGVWFRSPAERGITTFAYRVERTEQVMPAWAGDAIIYQIFLDRFHPGTDGGAFPAGAGPHDRHGGTLRGVRQALPYLAELGVTCLWLSPPFRAETYHRYDVTDLYAIDPALGTAEDLRDLTGAAHQLGMRVILDFVPSHCSWHHPAFVAAQRSRQAPSATWFTFDQWPDRYRCFLGVVPMLPSWNTEDPGARAHIIGSAVQWLRDCGIDGYRLDHAIGPGMDFWTAFRAATRAAAPHCFTVGEVTDSPDAQRRYRGRLDGVLDFQLAGALRLTFGAGAWTLGRLDTFLDAYDRFMAEGPGRVSFLDNHDMERFLFVARQDVARLKLAALCQFTLAPTPTIYYGTEIGLTHAQGFGAAGFGGDALARGDMIWDRDRWDHDLLRFYQALVRLRARQPALRSGARRTVWLDDATSTYAYLRTGAGQTADPNSGDILIVFNLSDGERRIPLPIGYGSIDPLLSTGAPARIEVDDGRCHAVLAPRTGAALRAD